MKLSDKFWFPGGLLLLAAAGVQIWPNGRAAAEPLLTLGCLVVLALGAVLGVQYNRSRPVGALIVLGASLWLLPGPDAAALPWRTGALALLIPLNLIFFSLLPDRGLRARTSFAGGVVLALQALALIFWPRAAVPWLEQKLAWAPFAPDWFRWSWAGQPALLAFGLAALVLAGHFFWRRRPTDRGLFWALAAAFMAVHVVRDTRLVQLYVTSGALIVTLSLFEHAHALAYVDSLTGLPSRRALDECLAQTYGRFAVALVDIDHFKRFNDSHGHAAGDQALRKVAAHLATVGGKGRAFRYGGEEFVVVFAGQTRQQALPHLETIRAQIESTAFGLRSTLRPQQKPKRISLTGRGGGRKVYVTVSIGVAETTEKHASPHLVIEAADKALYRAKELGRNQVQAA